jgi:hypothetical protein
MLSALPPLATHERTFQIGSFVPIRDSCTAKKTVTPPFLLLAKRM